MAYTQSPQRSNLANYWDPNAPVYSQFSGSPSSNPAPTQADLGLGVQFSTPPPLGLNYPGTNKPVAEGANAAGVALGVGASTVAGGLAGTTINPGVGTVIGAVLGLAEGIVSAAIGSSSSQRSFNQQLQAFNNQMRSYYEHSNNVIEEMRQRRKGRAEDKAYTRRNFERRMKLDAFLTGRKMKKQQRAELSTRWS